MKKKWSKQTSRVCGELNGGQGKECGLAGVWARQQGAGRARVQGRRVASRNGRLGTASPALVKRPTAGPGPAGTDTRPDAAGTRLPSAGKIKQQ